MAFGLVRSDRVGSDAWIHGFPSIMELVFGGAWMDDRYPGSGLVFWSLSEWHSHGHFLRMGIGLRLIIPSRVV